MFLKARMHQKPEKVDMSNKYVPVPRPSLKYNSKQQPLDDGQDGGTFLTSLGNNQVLNSQGPSHQSVFNAYPSQHQKKKSDIQ